MKCSDCPFKNIKINCFAERHSRLCELKNTNKAYKQIIKDYTITQKFPTPVNNEPQSNFNISLENTAGKIKIGWLVANLGCGGAETWQNTLINNLDKTKFTFMGMVKTCSYGTNYEEIHNKLSSIMPIGSGMGDAKKLAHYVDILISWSFVDYDEILENLSNKLKIIQTHHFPADRGNYINSATHQVAVSELANNGSCDVIWNCVDNSKVTIGRDRQTMRDLWGVPRDSLVFGSIGRLAPEKNIESLIDAAKMLPDWYCVIVGDSSHKQQLVKQAHGSPNVRFIEPDFQSGDVINAFDYLIVPSEYESFGLTIAEGLYVGCPVISTVVGIEKIHPGLTHNLPNNPTGIDVANAILSDERDKARKVSRIEQAREFAQLHLSQSKFIDRWENYLIGLDPEFKRRLEIQDSWKYMKLVKQCPFRAEPSCGCASVPAICHRPDQDGLEVYQHDCISCVKQNNEI